MKYIYSIFILKLILICTFNLHAQTINFTFSELSRKVLLGSSADTTRSNNPKALVTIVPRETQYWIYAIYTGDGSESVTPGLLQQLFDHHLCENSALSEKDLQILKIPAGEDSVNVYLLNKYEARTFLSDDHMMGDSLLCLKEGSLCNVSHGIASINGNIEDTLYLGLRNLKSTHDCWIHIECAFINSYEVKDAGKGMKQSHKQLRDDFFDATSLGDFGWLEFTIGNYNECIRLSRKALDKNPGLAYVYFNLGLAYLAKGQSCKAKATYNKAIKVTRKSNRPEEILRAAMIDIQTYQADLASRDVARGILKKLSQIISKY